MLVVGTGAVASFMLPRLQASGQTLQVYGAPSARLAALQRYNACSQAEALGEHDGWLVVCKVGQNAGKIEELRQAPPPRFILVLQNGVSPELAWRAAWPQAQVDRGLNTYGVSSVAPGLARGGESGEIVVPRFSPWIEPLRRAGFKLSSTGNIEAAVWRKLVVNASLNVVAALGDRTNGEVLEQPLARGHARRAAEEVAMLAQACGIGLRLRRPAELMEKVARATADNICSTLADLRSGRVCEYDAINGEILRLARRRNLHLPMLEQLDRWFALISVSGRADAPLAS